MLNHAALLSALVPLSSGIFYLFSPNGTSLKYGTLHEEVNTLMLQDDVVNLIGETLNELRPLSVGFLIDSIYEEHIYSQGLMQALGGKSIFVMSIKDSEAFETQPSTMLSAMRERNCDLYVILITNGIQASAFVKYADYHRLLNTKSKVLMLHDYRLFTQQLHYIWRRLVNVIFVRRCDMKRRVWYEMSTVPFPARIQDVFVPKVVNFWSPSKGFRWKKEIFESKTFRHLNGATLQIVVLQHTPTVFKVGDDFLGLEVDLVSTLSEIMNFSPEFFEPADVETEKWGRNFGERNFSGLLGEMDGAQADLALGDLHYTMLNLDVMDLSIAYNVECLTFITPEVLNDNSWKTLIAPFSLGMWIGVLVSLFCIGIVFFSFSNVYVFIKSGPAAQTKAPYFAKDFFDDLSASILYTYSMMLVVSLPRFPLRWSVRVLTGWWWIYCILLVVAYRASLTSILANPQPRLTIDSLEVLSGSWLKCGAWGEQNRNFFLMSSDQAAQKIGTKLELIDNADEAASNTFDPAKNKLYSHRSGEWLEVISPTSKTHSRCSSSDTSTRSNIQSRLRISTSWKNARSTCRSVSVWRRTRR